MEESNKAEQEIQINNIEIWDNSKRARTMIVIFWILTGITTIGVISGYFELELLNAAQLGEFIGESEVNANDQRQGIIGILQLGIFIASVVVFLNWFRRAYGNLHRMGINYLKQKESMAVWSWLIPIVWFFRPVQIMNEIWTETQDQIKKYDSSYLIRSGGFLIGIWWTLFILSNFIGRYVLKTTFKQDTIEQIIESSQATMIADIMEIPEALLVILIVSQISKMEKTLAEEVKKSGGNIIYK